MRSFIRTFLPLLSMSILICGCANLRGDRTGPTISDISTSSKVLVISDCLGTSVTISARATDASKIDSVQLWYRVGSDQTFVSIPMELQKDVYTATVKGSDLQGGGYGVMEFYITARDQAGNSTKSPLDQSVQFLPCVSH